MILLFDTNAERALGAVNFQTTILYWHDNAWRNFKGDRTPPPPTEAWFLVHGNDWDAFTCRLAAMDVAYHQLPVIRFTGGDPSGKPDDEYWVRYRPISAAYPFTQDEIKVMDRWVKRGCKSSETPWICSEEKPLHLLGLLILLKAAGSISLHKSQDAKGWNVSTSVWWKSRLEKEQDWQGHLREEWRRREGKESPLLEAFIEWVEGGGKSFDLESKLDELLVQIGSAVGWIML